MNPSDGSNVDLFLATRGAAARARTPSPDCLSDEILAGYVSALLPARERLALEAHALACADCHELLQTVVEVLGARRVAAAAVSEPASVRVIARLVQRGMQRGLELLNAGDLVFRTLVQGGPTPALGALRGAAGAPPASDLFVIRGPGSGLDELHVQVQADGTARLTVHCRKLPELRAGESLSIVLEVDGAQRERRAFTGEPVSFAPIGPGDHRVRLAARAAGQPARALAVASLQLSR